jgi:hypothetical protein
MSHVIQVTHCGMNCVQSTSNRNLHEITPQPVFAVVCSECSAVRLFSKCYEGNDECANIQISELQFNSIFKLETGLENYISNCCCTVSSWNPASVHQNYERTVFSAWYGTLYGMHPVVYQYHILSFISVKHNNIPMNSLI